MPEGLAIGSSRPRRPQDGRAESIKSSNEERQRRGETTLKDATTPVVTTRSGTLPRHGSGTATHKHHQPHPKGGG